MQALMGRRGRHSRWAGALFVAVMLGVAGSVHAAEAPKDPKADAKAHFRAGENHYNLNEFTDALTEFKEAYRLYPDPVFLYNLGQCERQLGHLEEAIRFYRSFLREQPRAANRQDVLRRIDEMEEVLRTRQEAAAVAPAATLPAAVAPAAVLPAAAPAAAPVSASPGPAAPAAATPTLAAAPAVEPPPSAQRIDLATSSAPLEPTTGSEPIYKRWWFWTAAAVVVVGAGVGIYAATVGGGDGGPTTELGAKRVF